MIHPPPLLQPVALVAVENLAPPHTFFVAGAIVFRLVTTLEAYLRTSGESNHYQLLHRDASRTTSHVQFQ